MHRVEAHEGEILALAYTAAAPGSLAPGCSLASGGGDGLIHLYDVTRQYSHLKTMPDHKGPVTSVRFALSDSRLLSCGADKTLKFRTLDDSKPCVAHSCASTIFDMDIDVTHKYAIAASKDRRLHVWSVAQAKPVRSYKLGNVGEPYKARPTPPRACFPLL